MDWKYHAYFTSWIYPKCTLEVTPTYRICKIVYHCTIFQGLFRSFVTLILHQYFMVTSHPKTPTGSLVDGYNSSKDPKMIYTQTQLNRSTFALEYVCWGWERLLLMIQVFEACCLLLLLPMDWKYHAVMVTLHPEFTPNLL